jgi:hypothetical protein
VNPTITPSWRKVSVGEERKRKERKKEREKNAVNSGQFWCIQLLTNHKGVWLENRIFRVFRLIIKDCSILLKILLTLSDQSKIYFVAYSALKSIKKNVMTIPNHVCTNFWCKH